MSSIEKRLVSLEARRASRWVWVWVNKGETEAHARKRAGIADAERVIYFSWKGTKR